MKTIRTIILILCAFFCITKATAQTFYYNTTRTFQLPGRVTYRAYLDEGCVTLYNTDNRFVHQPRTLRNGAPVPEGFWTGTGRLGPRLLDNPDGILNDNMRLLNIIVANNLTPEELQRVGRYRLGIDVFINPHAARRMPPAGVSFRFVRSCPWATIPVETFRRIEEHIKQHLLYFPNEKGRQLNFIRIAYTVDVGRGGNQRLHFHSQPTNMDVMGLFIGGTYIKRQIENQLWGSVTSYRSSMSEQTGLNEVLVYIMCTSMLPNQFRLSRNGIFYSFDVRVRYFPVFTAFNGGVRVGDNISRVQAIGLGTPVRQSNGNYHLVRSGLSNPLVFHVSGAGVITRMMFTHSF
jgi:hypothetical protein